MGFDEGRMVLDSPNGTYYSGQPVQGKLIFHQDKVKIFRGLFVKLKGFCHVHWTTTRSRTVNGKSQSYTVHHNAHEEYINDKTYLVGGESGEVSIGPGNHEYPFHFRLPENCPASFEGDYGHIRYEIKAVVDRAFKFDQEKKIAVRVMAPMNLNLDPYCKEPIEMLFEEAYCCCCMSSGVCNALVKLPVAGYCPGQTIPIDLVVNNKGGVEINDIKLCITKKVTFIATSEPGRKKCKDKVVEIKKGSIPGNTNRTWTLEMEVPAMDVYNLTGCQYITLEYAFKVVINPSGCHSDSKESRRLVLGTIPLVGFQDNVQNPLHDQLPQPIPQPAMAAYPPVINAYPEGNPPQPLNPPFPQPQPYPGNSPYPPANQQNPPYPLTNSPYPPTSSPYPPTISPYPPTSSPYPPTSSPYPPNSSPYPSANPPYPNDTPYRDNPPPYPGNLTNPGSSPPYPVENPPYPSEKSPFLGGNSQNPGSNPPYPGIHSPYPPQNVQYQTKSNPNTGSIGGLKTGNLGFAVPSGAAGMNLPSFPPTKSSPSPRPAIPYATASAPAPDSPDVLPEKKD